MKRRCFDPKCHKYKNYGSRGITICDRWLDPVNGFQNFLSDIGPRPSKGYSIERIDVNGNYTPENCKWIPIKEQSYNKTNTYVIPIGTTYNSLTILEEVASVPKRTKGNRRRVKVLCKCGNTKVVRLDAVIYGTTKTCGIPPCSKYVYKSKLKNQSVCNNI